MSKSEFLALLLLLFFFPFFFQYRLIVSVLLVYTGLIDQCPFYNSMSSFMEDNLSLCYLLIFAQLYSKIT